MFGPKRSQRPDLFFENFHVVEKTNRVGKNDRTVVNVVVLVVVVVVVEVSLRCSGRKLKGF